MNVFECLSHDICPHLIQKHLVPLSTCSSSDLNSIRKHWVERVIFQLLCQLYLLSSPLAHFPGIPASFYRAPLAFSKISAGIRARLSFSLGGFGKCQQRNHVNPTSSKSLYKLMHELEEWKSDLLLDDFFDLNECLLFSSISLLLPIQFSIL